MDVGSALVVRVDDDLVHQLHQLVVRRRRDFVRAGRGPAAVLLLVEAREQVADRLAASHAGVGAEEVIERELEVLLAGDAEHDLGAREDVVDHARALHALGIGRHHHDARLGVLERHPVVRLGVVALDVLQQVRRLDAVGLVGLVGDAEELGERGADRLGLDLEFLDEDVLDVLVLAPRGLGGEVELPGGDHVVDHQVLELRLDGAGHRLAHAEGDRERLGELHHALVVQRVEGLPGEVVDELDHAHQVGA